MAITVKELRDWLKPFYDDDLAAIGEGGLTLEITGFGIPGAYLRIGDWPLDEEED